MKTILLCDSPEHAEIVDQIVLAQITDEEGARGQRWSGVLTDGTRYGVLWAAPVSSLFGVPEDFPELVLVEETEEQPWTEYTDEVLFLLPGPTLPEAEAHAARVEAAARPRPRLWVDYGNPTRYGMEWSPDHADLFTAEEQERLIEGQPITRVNGRFVSGNWEVYA